MTAANASLRRQPLVANPPDARIAADRRRHKRVPLVLQGRFMRANKQESACKLQDISVGGAAMLTTVAVNPDERIVAYFEELGGLEGTVARVFAGGFAIKFSITAHKREKLAAQLTYLVNKSLLTGIDARRHERVELHNSISILKLPDGGTHQVTVQDVSISGASVGTDIRPPMGTEVVLGKLRATVVRHHATGIGLQFIDIQNPAALRRYFG